MPSSIIDIISDFTILLLPLPLIWRLQLTTTKKLGVYAIFGVGFFACMASVGALITSISLLRMASNDMDVPFAMDGMGLWTIAEIAIGILVGCLPVLPKFFQQFSRTKKSAQCKPNRYAQIGRPDARYCGVKALDCNEVRQSPRTDGCFCSLDIHANLSKPATIHLGLRNDWHPVLQAKQAPVGLIKSSPAEESHGNTDDRDLEE
ncbi:hypothetical protein MMC27_008033 [Xylographa pallens]|nr:hypothetical protein [Xylographa pallens]